MRRLRLGRRAFERAYAELERSLFGGQHAYAAVAPLVGISVVTQVELGDGIRMRAAATGELAASLARGAGTAAAPTSAARSTATACSSWSAASRPARSRPTRPAELADAVSAIRLATAAPVAAGPVLFERLDWRPFGIRPVLPIAATQPPGEPTRLDSFRAELARELLARLALADADAALAEALDRWELSLFQHEPFRSEQLRGALAGLLGDDLGAARAPCCSATPSEERRAIHAALRALAAGEQASERAEDTVRRSLVETLRHGDRAALVRSLDDALLGLRARRRCVAADDSRALVTKP